MEIRIRISDRLVRFVKGVFSRRFLPFLFALIMVGVTVVLLADPFAIPFDFKAGDVISSAQMNANFQGVEDRVNAIQGVVENLAAGGESLWVPNGTDYFYNLGNVGIGTDTPLELLSVVDNTSDYHVQLGYDGTHYWNLGQNKADFRFSLYNMNAGTGGELVSISPDGKVGIGTSSPAYRLDVKGTVFLQGPVTVGTGIELNPSSLAYSWIMSWCVGIGTKTPAYKLQVGTSGDGSSACANSWTTFSDGRHKRNITALDHALEKIEGIAGYYYQGAGPDESRQIGVVAQEVEEVLPEVVSTGTDGYKSVDYGRLAAVLIEAVKELKSENELLKQRLDDLEAHLK